MKILKILLIVFIVVSCKTNESKKEIMNKDTDTLNVESEPPVKNENENFIENGVDDKLSARISNFIKDSIVKKDIEFLNETDRSYQFYTVDLNSDGKDEVFVKLNGSYFCGSGGCTILLLNAELHPITTFTVMRPPLFIENTKKNNWAILLVKSEGEFKELTYNNGTYPSNPSILPKAPYDAPSGHAQIAFDDNYGKSKTYTF